MQNYFLNIGIKKMEEFKLKFITNEFLNSILAFDRIAIGFLRREYFEFVSQDNEMHEKADRFVARILELVKPLREMLEESIDTEWQPVVTEVAYRAYFAKLFKGNETKIREELEIALELRKSGICMREVRISEFLDYEIGLLERALKVKPVKYIVNALYYLTSRLYPSYSEKQKCIIVSEIMSRINLYANKPYQTLEEANLKAKENLLAPSTGSKLNEYNTDGAKNIYLRIKNEIDKNFILKP
tara:strand:- start:22136 stop:22864 length:729 start_codon:yes stop_codon:yes gene_type:complete